MTEEILQTPALEHADNDGFPVDLKREEFLHFSLTVAKKMGPMKSQKPLTILFGVYFGVILFTLFDSVKQSGKVDWMLIAMLLITALSMVLSLTLMPKRIKKQANTAFDVGNHNHYYGEITVTPHAILKNLGDETVCIPFTEQTLYMEDTQFMAFTTAGEQRSIILPARCMTEDMAKTVREAVFAQQVRLQRRVFSRMQAAASTPIAKQPFAAAPQTLYALDFMYTPEEFAKLNETLVWKQYFAALPGFSAFAVLLGMMLAFYAESILWFPVTSLILFFGYLLLTLLRSKRKFPPEQEINRTHMVLTQRGIELKFSPSGQRMSIGWKGMERAVERDDCVEFFHSGGHLLRVPKRAIEDMNTLRELVDTYFEKK